MAGRWPGVSTAFSHRSSDEMKPLAENLNAIARDAARISGLAAGQVERVERLVTDLAFRLEQTATTVQDAILKPDREGAACWLASELLSMCSASFPDAPAPGVPAPKKKTRCSLVRGGRPSAFTGLTPRSIGGRNRPDPPAKN